MNVTVIPITALTSTIYKAYIQHCVGYNDKIEKAEELFQLNHKLFIVFVEGILLGMVDFKTVVNGYQLEATVYAYNAYMKNMTLMRNASFEKALVEKILVGDLKIVSTSRIDIGYENEFPEDEFLTLMEKTSEYLKMKEVFNA